MIRVVLAEDHHLVRQGIRLILEKAADIQVLAEAENGQQLVHLVQTLQPDVVVMDINMPELNGIQAAAQIQQLPVETRIVILSVHSDETLIRQALRNGVKGYLLKRSVTEDLLLAIRSAHQGEFYLSPTISKIVSQQALTGSPDDKSYRPFDTLSAREYEVLKFVAEGYTNKRIAQTMHLSIKTVEKHRANLMSKLNVYDVASLVRLAIKHRVIFLEE